MDLFKRNYLKYCDDALRDFCKLFWPCEFQSRSGNCVNVLEGHKKGHQNENGKIIGSGEYESTFSFESYLYIWRNSILTSIIKFQNRMVEKMGTQPSTSEKDLVSIAHRTNIQNFYRLLKGAQRFVSHSACFCCLREMPEHPLPCGHVLCTPCVRTYSELDMKMEGMQQKDKNFIRMDRCPLHLHYLRFTEPWILKFKPDLAGVRILSLDGYVSISVSYHLKS